MQKEDVDEVREVLTWQSWQGEWAVNYSRVSSLDSTVHKRFGHGASYHIMSRLKQPQSVFKMCRNMTCRKHLTKYHSKTFIVECCVIISRVA